MREDRSSRSEVLPKTRLSLDLILLFSVRLGSVRVHSEYLELWRPEEEDKPWATLAHHAGKTRQKREEERKAGLPEEAQKSQEELPAERRQDA